MISIARRTIGRVTNWKDGTMKRRLVTVGMLEAERSFRRVWGYMDTCELVSAFRKEVNALADKPTQHDRAVA